MKTPHGLVLVALLTAATATLGMGCNDKTPDEVRTPAAAGAQATGSGGTDPSAAGTPGDSGIGELPEIPPEPPYQRGPSARR